MTSLALPRVLVIGATGMLGRPVTEAFARKGFAVSGLVRKIDGHQSATWTPLQGDVFDSSSLISAMSSVDGVYINLATPPTARETDKLTEREGLANVLAAAKATKVKRVGMISPLFKEYQGTDGYDWWVLRMKAAAEKAVVDSGVPYTIFQASSFFENLEGGMRRGNNIAIMGKKWQVQRYIAADDYADLVANAFSTNETANQTLVAQGPEAINLETLAKRYIAAHTREKLGLQKAPLGVMKFIGLFSKELGGVARMMEALDAYPEPFAAQATWDRFGAPRTNVERFANRD